MTLYSKSGGVDSIPAGVKHVFHLLWTFKGRHSLPAYTEYTFYRVLKIKKINSSNLIFGLIKLEANKRSQYDPHGANNFYCGFSPNGANEDIYETFNISAFSTSEVFLKHGCALIAARKIDHWVR